MRAPSDEGTRASWVHRAGTLDVERLEELALRVFEDALLLGQAPFVGYSIVSLSLDGPPEPALDNELLGRAGAITRTSTSPCVVPERP